MHLAMGWVFALFYLAAFHQLHCATMWLGAVIGLVHGCFVLLAGLPTLPGLHPRMATPHGGVTIRRQIEPPGPLGIHYGVQTPISVLVAHVLFGALLGALYRI
jgi:hypothetical protein